MLVKPVAKQDVAQCVNAAGVGITRILVVRDTESISHLFEFSEPRDQHEHAKCTAQRIEYYTEVF